MKRHSRILLCLSFFASCPGAARAADAGREPLSLAQGLSVSGQPASFCLDGVTRSKPSGKTIERMTQTPGLPHAGLQGSAVSITQVFWITHELGRLDFEAPRWAQDRFARLRKEDPEKFAAVCGQNFVKGAKVGARLELSLKILLRGPSTREDFYQESQFDLANLQTLGAHLRRLEDVRGVMQLSFLQSGGDPTQLSQRVLDPSRHLQCDLQTPAACLAAIKAFQGYALDREGWLDQLRVLWERSEYSRLLLLDYESAPYPSH